jgi:hypothetical protein
MRFNWRCEWNFECFWLENFCSQIAGEPLRELWATTNLFMSRSHFPPSQDVSEIELMKGRSNFSSVTFSMLPPCEGSSTFPRKKKNPSQLINIWRWIVTYKVAPPWTTATIRILWIAWRKIQFGIQWDFLTSLLWASCHQKISFFFSAISIGASSRWKIFAKSN